MFSDKRLCFDPEGFRALLDTLQTTFGSAGCSMIFQMSMEYGKHLLHKVMPFTEEEYINQVEGIEKRFAFMGALGWGEFTLLEYSLEDGVIKIGYHSDVISPLCTMENSTMCIFIKGVLLGAFNEMTGIVFRIEDHECVHKEGSECKLLLQAVR